MSYDTYLTHKLSSQYPAKSFMEYPKQIKKAFTKDAEQTLTTFSLDEQLVIPKEDSDRMPLEMHEAYSRFVATILKTNKAKKSYVYANIPAEDDADYIIERTRNANTILMQQEISGTKEPESTTEESKAYTVKIGMGKWKNMTPAEVLLSGAGTREELLSQIAFLERNVHKYPINAERIEAIKEALQEEEAGTLSAEASMAATDKKSTITIYHEEFKPLKSTKDEEGYCRIYSIHITCEPGKRYPYEVQITNIFGKMNDNDEVIKESLKGRESASIRMTEKKWTGTVKRMERTLQHFEMIHFCSQYKKAIAADNENFKNRQMAREAESSRD